MAQARMSDLKANASANSGAGVQVGFDQNSNVEPEAAYNVVPEVARNGELDRRPNAEPEEAPNVPGGRKEKANSAAKRGWLSRIGRLLERWKGSLKGQWSDWSSALVDQWDSLGNIANSSDKWLDDHWVWEILALLCMLVAFTAIVAVLRCYVSTARCGHAIIQHGGQWMQSSKSAGC